MMRLRATFFCMVLAAALVALPALAEACPACAGRDRGGPLYLALLGAFILLPFAIVKVVHKAIKAEERRSGSP